MIQAGGQAGVEMRAANKAAESVESQVVLGKAFSCLLCTPFDGLMCTSSPDK